MKILVADHNKDANDILRQILVLDGHEVAVAHRGQEALSLFDAMSPQVVFLGIGLPDINGFDVATSMRVKSGAERPTIFAMSGYNGEEYAQRAQAAGIDRWLVKPIDIDEIRKFLMTQR